LKRTHSPSTILRDLRKSSRAFYEICLPQLKEDPFFAGEWLSLEDGERDSLAWRLDRHAGIDAIQICNKKYLRSWAIRCQPNVNYQTFTIRSYKQSCGIKTELFKRQQAINNNFMLPNYTLQVYYAKEKVLSAAWIYTEDLFNMGASIGYRQVCSNAEFIVVKFADLEDLNILKGYIKNL